jgi:predicted DNA-binding protein
MKAKHYTIVVVRMPHELHDVLETIAISKGETSSVVVRDLVRQAGEVRRVDRGIPQIQAAASGISGDRHCAGRAWLKQISERTTRHD